MVFDRSDGSSGNPVNLHLVFVLVDFINLDLFLAVGQTTLVTKNPLILLLLPVRELVVAQSVTLVKPVVVLLDKCIILLEDLKPLFKLENVVVMDAELSKMLDVADLCLESGHR